MHDHGGITKEEALQHNGVKDLMNSHFFHFLHLGFHDKLFKLEMHPENILFKPAQYTPKVFVTSYLLFDLLSFDEVFGEEKL